MRDLEERREYGGEWEPSSPPPHNEEPVAPLLAPLVRNIMIPPISKITAHNAQLCVSLGCSIATFRA